MNSRDLKLLYGTGNPAKLDSMKRRLSTLGIEVIRLKDIDDIPDSEQPGVHIRRINGKYLTDDEMVEYYTKMAVKYGNLVARYKNAICLYISDDRIYSAMDKDMESEPFIITRTLGLLDFLRRYIGGGIYVRKIKKYGIHIHIKRR